MGRHYTVKRPEPSLLERRVRYYLGDADGDRVAELVSLLRRFRSLDEGQRIPKRLIYDLDRFMVQEVERVDPGELEELLRRMR